MPHTYKKDTPTGTIQINPFVIEKGIPVPAFTPRKSGLKIMNKIGFNLKDMKVGDSVFYSTYREGHGAIIKFRAHLKMNNIDYKLRQAREKKGVRIIRIK